MKDEMTEKELDEMLDGWKAPAPSPALRARVLGSFPRRKSLGWWRPVRWATAMAAIVFMIAIGGAQTGNSTLGNLGNGIHDITVGVEQWFDYMWIAHIMLAFRNSNPKVYVDGELRTDAVFGSSGNAWLRLPGEGKYYIALTRGGFEGPVPPSNGHFDGHVLEFQQAGRSVRVESHGRYGFGGDRPVYALGPVAGR
jgi:hypothetical protein